MHGPPYWLCYSTENYCCYFNTWRGLNAGARKRGSEEKARMKKFDWSANLSQIGARAAARIFDTLASRGAGDGIIGTRVGAPLKWGENPYQQPALLYETKSRDPLAITRFQQVAGEPPCYVNLADLDAMLHIFVLAALAAKRAFGSVPWIVLSGKHGNPCGAAFDWDDPVRAVRRALMGNPRAIWGGEVVTNIPVTPEVARALRRSPSRKKRFGKAAWMLDIIAAPEFEEEAKSILGKRSPRKLMANPSLRNPCLAPEDWSYRPLRGGFMAQRPPHYVLDAPSLLAEEDDYSRQDISSLIIAWAVAWGSSLGGNEVALAKEGMLLGAGGGPSTVDAVNTAIHRTDTEEQSLTGAYFAANAFFPFTDGPDLLACSGVKGGVVPAGGMRQDLVRQFFKEAEIKVHYLPAEYRGFSRH